MGDILLTSLKYLALVGVYVLGGWLICKTFSSRVTDFRKWFRSRRDSRTNLSLEKSSDQNDAFQTVMTMHSWELRPRFMSIMFEEPSHSPEGHHLDSGDNMVSGIIPVKNAPGLIILNEREEYPVARFSSNRFIIGRAHCDPYDGLNRTLQPDLLPKN